MQTSCRPLKCPWGQMQLNNQCGYHSNSWVGGPFAVMLRLMPVRKNMLIPFSFFTDMPTTYRYDRKAKWLKRSTLTKWNFVFMYHQARETAFVDFIVVKATYPFTSVNPNYLAKMVNRALKDTWLMAYGNSSMELQVTFNKYNSYKFVTFAGTVNSTHDHGFCPSAITCLGLNIQNEFCIKELINPIIPISEKQLNEGIFVTKLFFCDQVELLPDEFSYNCLSVLLYVKNTTVHSFSKVMDLLNGDLKVRVCVDEFPLIGKTTSIMTACSARIFATVIMAMCSLN